MGIIRVGEDAAQISRDMQAALNKLRGDKNVEQEAGILIKSKFFKVGNPYGRSGGIKRSSVSIAINQILSSK